MMESKSEHDRMVGMGGDPDWDPRTTFEKYEQELSVDRRAFLDDLAKQDPAEKEKQLYGQFQATGTEGMSVGQLRQLSKSDLAREIQRLHAMVNKADLAGMVRDMQERRLASTAPPQVGATPSALFQHPAAFQLMSYRSEGGHFERKIWNSRDGMAPSQIHIDGLQYLLESTDGPYLDRPEGCEAQWETRTEMSMMEAWQRSLTRAVLGGKMSKQKADGLASLPEAARQHLMHIGLRSMATGKFTDEA